ncbi:50S ribosomal protein L18e [archaeon]|nr:50S ribosomal protein L18e [archaeon]
MPHPTGPTDDNILKLISELRKTRDSDYIVLARCLERPKRTKNAVNVGRIQKMKGDKFVVAGKVLGTGDLVRVIDVYAMSFSAAAKTKIEKAGGKTYTIYKMVKDKAKAKLVA